MKLSPYELLRLERIKRNAERLKELGLDKNPLQAKPKNKKRKFKKVDKPTPGQERRSRRLSSKKNDNHLVMLDYRAKDGEEIVSNQNGSGYDSDVAPQRRIGTIIRKKFPETGEYYEGKVTDYDAEHKWYKIKYLDGDEEEFDEEELTLHRRVGTIIRRELSESGKYHEGEVIEFDNTRKLYRVKYPDGKEEDIGVEDLKEHRTQNQKTVQKRTKQFRQRSRSLKIDAEDWKLSEKDRESLSCADENFLAKFEEFLEYENRISEQNKRNVMRQVRKLASGEGIRYESAAYGWPEGCYFKKGEKITPMSDIVELMVEGQACEDEWGRDHGNGWLISHPLKKLLLFQQFILNNPDFLTSELRLKDYCA